MTQKWNLQDIRPAQTRKRRIPEGVKLESVQSRILDENSSAGEEDIRIPVTNGTKQKNKSLFVALLVFFVVLGGGLAMSALMGGAEVTVYPRHKEPSVNAEFVAYKVADAGKLPYELMTLEAEGELQVKATGEEQVSTQAQGTIFIYNEAQKAPLRLVTNTRFESTNGLLFKIKDSVVVPGYTMGADGKKVRGVATASVYADQAGAQYNLGPSRFTVPGFKGEPEYTTIYAESTDTFKDGFNDKKFIIDEAELQTAEQTLRTELRNSLLGRIDSEKPAKFTLFKDAVTFTYESLPSVPYGAGLATIKEKVLLRVPIFKEDDFAKNLAAVAVPDYGGEPVRIADTSVLTFSYKSATTSSSDISNYELLTFTLAGKPQIIWKYDDGKLKSDLLNANKTALNIVLGGYPAIERATGIIRPFWKSKFPTKIDEIEIIEVISEKKS